MMQWYIIHTLSGQENKVKTVLEKRLEAEGFKEKVEELVIPQKEVIEVQQSKKITRQKKVFPGYIFAKMELTDELWRLIRYTPGVFGIIGDSLAPTPLDDQEIKSIFTKVKTGLPKTEEIFKLNETVRVISGPFKNFIGTVEEINPKHGKLKVMMNILGRATPVELDISQVERL